MNISMEVKMDMQKIRKAMSQLPIITVGTIPQDHQIIEGDEYDAHYKITKETPPTFPGLTIYALSVFGAFENRQKVIDRFIEVLGQPLNRFQPKIFPGIDFLCWQAIKNSEEAVF